MGGVGALRHTHSGSAARGGRDGVATTLWDGRASVPSAQLQGAGLTGDAEYLSQRGYERAICRGLAVDRLDRYAMQRVELPGQQDFQKTEVVTQEGMVGTDLDLKLPALATSNHHQLRAVVDEMGPHPSRWQAPLELLERETAG